MATITENMRSREGDEAGQSGFFARREFDVLLRDAGDDVNAPLTALESQIAIGSGHPDATYAGLFSSQYRVLERVDGMLDFYKCEIVYRPPFVFTTSGWDIRFSSAVESRQVTHDMRDQRIGGNSYRLPGKNDDGSPETPTHFADTIDGSVKLVSVGRVVRPEPTERFMQVGSMSLRRQIPETQLTIDMIQVSQGFAGQVNNDNLPNLGITFGQLLYLGGSLEKVSSQNQFDSSSAASWDISLEFSVNYSADGWVRKQIFDWYDVKGRRGDVHAGSPTGPVVKNTFIIYPTISFSSLFSVFGSIDIFNVPVPRRR